jgi:hypothetical protein
MPINNKGRFKLGEVTRQQINTDWPVANTDFDLYVQDLIASGNLIANGLIIRNIEVSDNILSGNITASGITANTLVLDILTSNTGIFENLTVNGDLVVEGNTVTLNVATLTIEDKNIVLANGAADASTADGAGITIDGAGANITYRESGDKIEINKTVEVLGDLNVTGNISGNGLVIRGIEVSDAVLSGNITVEGGITGNTIAVDAITANIWNNLYTANVIETSGNLYFTVQRARDSFTAGQNITIVDGEISSEAQFLTVVNDSTTITATQGNLTYGMGRSVNDSRNILVIVEGLIQIPQTDYTVDSSDLTFTDQPPAGANIEIRFFGAEGSSGSRPTLISTVNSFIGTGNVDYALTQTPPGKSYVTVIIDGVTQQNEAYNVTGSVLTFTEAPAVGANVDIRIITGQVGAPFNTRTFTGDGSNTIFTISDNFNQDQILVFENGVAQVPGTDYTVSAGNVIFNTAPAANVGIQIRELASSGANLLTTISGLNQTTGSLVPDVDGVRSLGSSTKKFKDLYLTGNTIVLGDIALSSLDGLLQVSPVVEGNVIVANVAPASFVAGDNISIEANGRISTTNTLALTSVTNLAGNTAISVSSSGQAIFTHAISQPGSFMFRNRIINGDMRIDQRNNGNVLAIAGGAYSIDRWRNDLNVTYNGRFSSQQGIDLSSGFYYTLKETVTTIDTANNAASYYLVDQPIEGNNILDLAYGRPIAKPVAISFRVQSSVIGTFGGSLQSDNGSYIFQYDIIQANTWQTVEVSIPPNTQYDLSSNTNGVGLYLRFDFGSGSNFEGVANQWQAGNKFRVANNAKLINNPGATWSLTGVQLEVGETATPFEQLPYGMQLSLCQRYYYKTGPSVRYSGYNNSTTLGDYTVIFPTTMRVAPSALEQSGTAAHYGIQHGSTTTNCSAVPTHRVSSAEGATFRFTVASGLTAGQGSLCFFNTGGYLAWSGELIS